MGALSQRIIDKVSGPAWEQIRGQFMQMAQLFLSVSPDADSKLLNTYVKFTTRTDPNSPVFAVVWLKSGKQMMVGLALPEEYDARELGPAPLGTTYKGLNKYFIVQRGGTVPEGFAEWAGRAYQNASSADPWTTVANLPQHKDRCDKRHIDALIRATTIVSIAEQT
jgi:hypothetical protein